MIKLQLTLTILLIAVVCSGTAIKVTRVIDGDTFVIETGEKVRLVGINAPEISDLFGQESKEYLTELIENKAVELQRDYVSNDHDRYDRLLRYVMLDGVDINLRMVSDGFAFANLKYQFSKSSDYQKAEKQAREENKGIWGNERRENIPQEQEVQQAKFSGGSLLKAYFVISVVLILMLLGIYHYFKK